MTVTITDVDSKFFKIIQEISELFPKSKIRYNDYDLKDVNETTMHSITHCEKGENLSKPFASIDDLMSDLKNA